MYRISYFTENDKAEILSFMHSHSFAMLMATDSTRPVATQVPLLISEQDGTITLRGHIMRKTDHHKALEQNNNVLALFTGPQCYVSASWYSERGHGSTWNYMTVQASGTLKFLDDEGTLQILRDLTHRQEDNQTKPELVENMTEEYLRNNIKAIAGFEITVKDLHATFKLSQNRDDESYKTIVRHLLKTEKTSEKEIAEEMMKRRPKLFK